jgi:hypothetical protein
MPLPPGVDTKASIKRAVKALLMRRGSGGAFAGTRILTYHSVGARAHEMNVAPAAFAAQMAWLADYAPVIPLDDAARGLDGVALTFDDGYADNLSNAAPILNNIRFPQRFLSLRENWAIAWSMIAATLTPACLPKHNYANSIKQALKSVDIR